MTVLKAIGESDVYPKYNELWNYIGISTIFRGFTFFKSADFQYGMSIFDFKLNRINYLEVNFEYYTSDEE